MSCTITVTFSGAAPAPDLLKAILINMQLQHSTQTWGLLVWCGPVDAIRFDGVHPKLYVQARSHAPRTAFCDAVTTLVAAVEREAATCGTATLAYHEV